MPVQRNGILDAVFRNIVEELWNKIALPIDKTESMSLIDVGEGEVVEKRTLAVLRLTRHIDVL